MSNPKHPAITFKVNLDTATSELIGPNTNSSRTGVLHPDMFDDSPDRGNINKAVHKNYATTFIPGFLCGENVIKNDDDTFTVYGMKAVYIKNTYTTGVNPILSVVE